MSIKSTQEITKQYCIDEIIRLTYEQTKSKLQYTLLLLSNEVLESLLEELVNDPFANFLIVERKKEDNE